MAHSAVGLGDKFLDEVLTVPDDVDLRQCPEPQVPSNPFEGLKDVEKMNERQISAEMTRIINAYNLAPGLNAALCENSPDSLTVDNLGQKVDSALFPQNRTPTDHKPHWADQLLPIEYKRHQTRGDPFDDTKPEVAADAEDLKKVRCQIISYVELVFAVQQRTHLIMMLVMGRKFRLLRWDRSGVTISLSIDYYDQWEVFCDVLWRISVLARFHPKQLGVDLSATRIFPDDPRWKEMDEAGRVNTTDADHKTHDLAPGELTCNGPVTFSYVRELFQASLKGNWPRYELDVPDGERMRKVFVGRPHFRAKGMTGRGTRGYVALDTDTGRFVWLKDAWRAHYTLVTKEGDILAQLNAANVSNVPTLVCHGDILGQTTKTPDFWELMHPPDATPSRPTTPTSLKVPSSSTSSSKRKRADEWEENDIPSSKGLNNADADHREDCPLRRHIHYRIVVEEVCLTLSFFEDGQQLVSIVYDCALAHFQATQNGILHRDISSGNILILPCIATLEDGTRFIEWNGVLTDWEMAKGLSDPRKPRQPERTGTWQYMSVARLDRPTKVVEIPDDIESFVYVLLYHAVRYLQSNCTSVPNWLEDFFDLFTYSNGEYNCGYKKRMTVMSGELIAVDRSNIRLQFRSPMDKLLNRLFQSLRAYYRIKLYEVAPTSETELPVKPSHHTRRKSRKSSTGQAMVGSSSSQLTEVTAPTEHERLVAQDISNHQLFLTLLRQCIDGEWRDGDKVGDRVPDDWVSIRPIGPTCLPAHGLKKKQRTNMHSLPAAINAESPTRRPTLFSKGRSAFRFLDEA